MSRANGRSARKIAFIDELACGFAKFNEDGPPDVRLGKLKFGKDSLPKRQDLGDLNEEDWEIVEGKPKDRWQPIMQLSLSPLDCIGELVMFSAIGTGGARSAVADLCGIFARSPRHGLLPIIELRTRSYKHKKYGVVHVPVLKLVSWHQTGPDLSGETENPEAENPGVGLDEEIIF
jgi:hypothetical protein